MYENLTFRQLTDLVARHGLELDERPRLITQMSKKWGISRTHFYNLLQGHKVPSEKVVSAVARGMQKIAPWVTQEIVEAAISKTRLMQEMRV